MSFEAIKKQEQEYILHSYGRVDVALSHGKNAEAWDVEGKHYYDFTSGIGVNALLRRGLGEGRRRTGGQNSAHVELLLL